MSARALRKLQRERELAAKAQEPEIEESDEEEEEPTQPKQNLFDLLGAEDEDERDEQEEGEEEEEEEEIKEEEKPAQTSSGGAKKKKNKKKKKKGKGAAAETPTTTEDKKPEEEEDEIDRALRELQLREDTSSSSKTHSKPKESVPKPKSSLLELDTRNLDVSVEVRRLFGKSAVEDVAPAPRGGPGNRGGRRGFVSAARKNLFVQPKPNWPDVGTGGLGMEILHRQDDGTTTFTFVHGFAYREMEMDFFERIFAMDHQGLGEVLRKNPYHVSTNLQLYEIALAEREAGAAGEFVERALFNLGRAVHSTFPRLLGEGKARLDFNRFESRELWLGVWRYIRNLGLKGCWRTAEEYGRMLFCLDPDNDPYAMVLILDYLAIKARQPEHLLRLIEDDAFKTRHQHLPNLAYSIALAYLQLKKPELATEYLGKAITRFPWVVPRLYATLNIDDPLPPVLWGAMPPATDHLQKVLAELYAERAVDIWKQPDALDLLKTTASTIHSLPRKKPSHVAPLNEVDPHISGVPTSVARHVVVTGINSVLMALPTEFRNMPLVSYDPYTPESDYSPYTSVLLQEDSQIEMDHVMQELQQNPGLVAQLSSLAPALPAWLRNMLPAGLGGTGAGEPQGDLIPPPARSEQTEGQAQDTTLGTVTDEQVRDVLREATARQGEAVARLRQAMVEEAPEDEEDEQEELPPTLEDALADEYLYRQSLHYVPDPDRTAEVVAFLLAPYLWEKRHDHEGLVERYKFLEGRDYAGCISALLNMFDDDVGKLIKSLFEAPLSLLPEPLSTQTSTDPPPSPRSIAENETPETSVPRVLEVLQFTHLADFPTGANQKWREAEEVLRNVLGLAPTMDEGGVRAFVAGAVEFLKGVGTAGREETRRAVRGLDGWIREMR